MTQKQQAKKLLNDFAKSVKCPTLKDDEHAIDLKALNELPETKALVSNLKALGYKTSGDLKPFIVAQMLLKY
jgi:tRNA G26 N,N-dimethylase Trm1